MSKKLSATIYAKPHFDLALNKDIVDLIIGRAKKHYDATCRKSCEQGGFLYGWNNCVDFQTTCSASFRQLDLTLKILENFCGSLEDARISLEYKTFIKDLLQKSKSLSSHTIQVNQSSIKDHK